MRRVKGPLTLSVTACTDISVAPHAAVGASSSKRTTRLLTLHDGQTAISALERTPLIDDAGAPLELLPGCEITLTDVGLFDGMLLLEPGCVALHSAAPPQPARVAPPTWEEGSIDVTDPPPRFARVAAAARVDGVGGPRRQRRSGRPPACNFDFKRALSSSDSNPFRCHAAAAARQPPPRSARPRG